MRYSGLVVKLDEAVERYLADMRAAGRINSPHTDASYRSRLGTLGEETANRDPRTIGADDVDRTLRRWPHPATAQHARSVYVSFFDWCQHQRMRRDNPARQTWPRKVKAPNVYRLTRGEVVALFEACRSEREARVIRIGCCAGLRNAELRGLQLRHFKRPGAIWVSADIAKGGRQRFVPVLAELEQIVVRILRDVAEDEYVIPARRPTGGRRQPAHHEVPGLPCSAHALRALVASVGRRAAIAAPIHPHLLRHAFGDHVARHAGIRAAQATLGHTSIATTAGTYTGPPTLDELSTALTLFRYEGLSQSARPPSPANTPDGT